jgi:hypothetical protein
MGMFELQNGVDLPELEYQYDHMELLSMINHSENLSEYKPTYLQRMHLDGS